MSFVFSYLFLFSQPNSTIHLFLNLSTLLLLFTFPFCNPSLSKNKQFMSKSIVSKCSESHLCSHCDVYRLIKNVSKLINQVNKQRPSGTLAEAQATLCLVTSRFDSIRNIGCSCFGKFGKYTSVPSSSRNAHSSSEDSDWGELEAILQESPEEEKRIGESSKQGKRQRFPRERGRKSQQLLSQLLFASPDGPTIEDIVKGGAFSTEPSEDPYSRALKRQAFIGKALEAFDKANRPKTRRHR